MLVFSEITYPRTFSQMQNPITRAIVQIDPPFIAETKAHEDKFVKHLYAYLAAGWDLRLASPETLSPAGGAWHIPVPDSTPSPSLAGSSPGVRAGEPWPLGDWSD